MVRKWPAIDILKLYSGKLEGFEDDIAYNPVSIEDVAGRVDASGSYQALRAHDKWNRWLRECLRTQNLEELIKTRYGLQVGMDDVVKKGLASPAICEMFVRWQSSIEKTARQIIKKRHKITHAIATDYLKAHEEKRRIDAAFEAFLRDSSF